LDECRDCALMFYAPRLTPDQNVRLYSNYRGEEYYRVRHRYEFWYTRAFNNRLSGESEMRSRRRWFLEAISRHKGKRVIGAVLDYGGDRGQILSEGPGEQRYVFDLSGAEPVPGVKRLETEEALNGRLFDLVLLCHVLEHAAAPAELLTNLRSRLTPTGLLYVEVPDERFPLTDIPWGHWYRRYLDILRRSLALTILLDFYSTAVRIKFRRIPPLGFAKMHEHVNLFGPASLAACLNKAGFRVLECNITEETGAIVAVAAA